MKKSLGAKTIIFPTPVLVVGTYDSGGKPNAMTVAWGGICCSEPPCVGIALREATQTYANILQHKAFTISIPSQKHVAEADYFGTATGATEDKFFATGLTPVASGLVDAPYVGEFPFVMECALVQSVKLGLHTQFIGEIRDIKADAASLDKMGMPDIEKIKPVIFSPANRSYYSVGPFLAKAFSIGKEKIKEGR